MSFDKIFDLTVGVYFCFYKYIVYADIYHMIHVRTTFGLIIFVYADIYHMIHVPLLV